MEVLVIFWILMWSLTLILCWTSARAGAANRLKEDEKYSFKKLYETLNERPDQKLS